MQVTKGMFRKLFEETEEVAAEVGLAVAGGRTEEAPNAEVDVVVMIVEHVEEVESCTVARVISFQMEDTREKFGIRSVGKKSRMSIA